MVIPAWNNFQKPLKQEQSVEPESMPEQAEESKSETQPAQWGNFKTPTTFQGEPDPTADEGMFEYLTRNAIANSSRVAEQVAGRFGNIEKFARDTLVNVPKSGGVLGWAVSELVGPERWERMVKGEDGQGQLFPRSSQFKEASEGLSGGYTSPKTKGEKRFQEFTEDAGALLNANTANQTARQLATNNILIPAAANVTKGIVEELGFGEDAANKAKLAIWLPLSFANNINAPGYASELMNRGREGIPQSLQFNVARLQAGLQNVTRNMQVSDPRSAIARQQANRITRDLARGQTSVRDLMNMYDGVNATKRGRGLFDLSKADRAVARQSIDQVRLAIKDEIRLAASSNPAALANWESGLQAWAVVHESQKLTNWISSTAKGPYARALTGPAAALFGLGSFGAAKAPIIAGPAAAAVQPAYKTGQALYRMWHSEPLREYYWNAVSAATTENLPVFMNNYNKLNKGLEKSLSSKPKSKSKK